MKKLLTFSAITAAAFALTAAQSPGTFSTTLTWDPYTDTNASSLRLVVRTGAQFTTTNIYTITNLEQNVITIPTSIGATYRALLIAVSPTGLESDPSNEITWTNPIKPTTPSAPRVVLIQYIP